MRLLTHAIMLESTARLGVAVKNGKVASSEFWNAAASEANAALDGRWLLGKARQSVVLALRVKARSPLCLGGALQKVK